MVLAVLEVVLDAFGFAVFVSSADGAVRCVRLMFVSLNVPLFVQHTHRVEVSYLLYSLIPFLSYRCQSESYVLLFVSFVNSACFLCGS